VETVQEIKKEAVPVISPEYSLASSELSGSVDSSTAACVKLEPSVQTEVDSSSVSDVSCKQELKISGVEDDTSKVEETPTSSSTGSVQGSVPYPTPPHHTAYPLGFMPPFPPGYPVPPHLAQRFPMPPMPPGAGNYHPPPPVPPGNFFGGFPPGSGPPGSAPPPRFGDFGQRPGFDQRPPFELGQMRPPFGPPLQGPSGGPPFGNDFRPQFPRPPGSLPGPPICPPVPPTGPPVQASGSSMPLGGPSMPPNGPPLPSMGLLMTPGGPPIPPGGPLMQTGGPPLPSGGPLMQPGGPPVLPGGPPVATGCPPVLPGCPPPPSIPHLSGGQINDPHLQQSGPNMSQTPPVRSLMDLTFTNQPGPPGSQQNAQSCPPGQLPQFGNFGPNPPVGSRGPPFGQAEDEHDNNPEDFEEDQYGQYDNEPPYNNPNMRHSYDDYDGRNDNYSEGNGYRANNRGGNGRFDGGDRRPDFNSESRRDFNRRRSSSPASSYGDRSSRRRSRSRDRDRSERDRRRSHSRSREYDRSRSRSHSPRDSRRNRRSSRSPESRSRRDRRRSRSADRWRDDRVPPPNQYEKVLSESSSKGTLY